MTRSELAQAPWWLAAPIALALLVAIDLPLWAWNPASIRFASSFSSAALLDAIDRAARLDRPVIVLGDSVVWGYGVGESDSLAAQLQVRTGRAVVNLAFQGGSPANTEVLVRLLAARGVRPSLVLFNVNPKTFNPQDQAYRRLQPPVERAAAALLDDGDRRKLDLAAPSGISVALGAAVERVWRLYAIRADVRERVFGAEDAATRLAAFVRHGTGAEERERAAHVPTADRFLGTYDLSPLGADNIQLAYLRRLRALLARHRMRYVAFLTPTNHGLLAEYIDVPEYAANLGVIRAAILGPGGRVLDLDRSLPPAAFIDNDHLTAAGTRRLTDRLLPALQ